MNFLHEAARRFTKGEKSLHASSCALWMNLFGGNMQTIWQDLRYSARMLVQKPGFTAIVVLSMALGISANATIFSFVNELLLRPPAVERPERLLEVWNHYRQGGSSFTSFEPLNYPEYEHYRDHNQVFTEMLAFDGDPAFISWSRQGQGEMVQGQYVSGNFFSCLGVKAAIGRTFLPEEDRTPNAHPVVVIGHGLWQRRFGGDPNVIGQTVTLNEHDFTVIGVAPKEFGSTYSEDAFDVWTPVMMKDYVARPHFSLTDRGSR